MLRTSKKHQRGLLAKPEGTGRIEPPPADFEIENGGNIYRVIPQNAEARKWLDGNVQAESWQWFGNALVVDHHYVADLVEGIIEAGFKVV